MTLAKIKSALWWQTERWFGIDVRALAAMRISFALLVLFDLFMRSRSLIAHYTDVGVLPRSVLLDHHSFPLAVSFHLISGIWPFQALLFVIAAIFAFMMLVGYRTRLATVVTWILYISLYNRNPLVVQGGDVLLRMSLFWGMFLPWHARYSIDAAWNRVKPYKQVIVSFATAAFLIQVAFVYIGNAMFKSWDVWWDDGTALYYALHIDQFATPLAYFIRDIPLITTTLSRFAIALEGFGPVLLFFPIITTYTRLIGALLYLGFHSGISFFMYVGMFPFIDIATILPFLPPLFWNRLTRWFRRIPTTPVAIYYDGECGFCYNTVRVIKTFFLPRRTLIAPATDNPAILHEMMHENSWIVIDNQNRHHTGYDGFLAIAGASPLLRFIRPLLRLPPLPAIGQRIYEWVATHRRTICQPAQPIPQRRWLRAVSQPAVIQTIAALLLAYVVWWNLADLPGSKLRLPPEWRWPASLLRLDQRWNMFSPVPQTADGWYVIPGTLADGTEVDVYRGTEGVNWQKPRYVGHTYSTQRWRKYLMTIWTSAYANMRPHYARYLCHRWNTGTPPEKQLTSLDIFFVLETTPKPGDAAPPPVRQHLWSYQCF